MTIQNATSQNALWGVFPFREWHYSGTHAKRELEAIKAILKFCKIFGSFFHLLSKIIPFMVERLSIGLIRYCQNQTNSIILVVDSIFMSIRTTFRVVIPTIVFIAVSNFYANGATTEKSDDSTITVKVILQTHRSPLKDFPSSGDTLAKVDTSQSFILETITKTSGDVHSAVVEAVFTAGSNLQPVSYPKPALELFGKDSLFNRIGEFVKVYGFEDKETHASGLLLLKRMHETARTMKEKSGKLTDIVSQMKTLGGEMTSFAAEMPKEKDVEKRKLLLQRFRSIETNFKNTQSEFQIAKNGFKRIEAENHKATVAFNTFRVIRSAEALQTALQVAINNDEKYVYIIIGSMHWDDLVAIENRIDTVKPRFFKLQKLEAN